MTEGHEAAVKIEAAYPQPCEEPRQPKRRRKWTARRRLTHERWRVVSFWITYPQHVMSSLQRTRAQIGDEHTQRREPQPFDSPSLQESTLELQGSANHAHKCRSDTIES